MLASSALVTSPEVITTIQMLVCGLRRGPRCMMECKPVIRGSESTMPSAPGCEVQPISSFRLKIVWFQRCLFLRAHYLLLLWLTLYWFSHAFRKRSWRGNRVRSKSPGWSSVALRKAQACSHLRVLHGMKWDYLTWLPVYHTGAQCYQRATSVGRQGKCVLLGGSIIAIAMCWAGVLEESSAMYWDYQFTGDSENRLTSEIKFYYLRFQDNGPKCGLGCRRLCKDCIFSSM